MNRTRRAVQSGFTLIELLIVVGIIGLLIAVLAPQIFDKRKVFLALAEQSHLQKLGGMLLTYKATHKQALPNENGHKLLLSLWTSKVMNHNEENFDLFWTPESQDPHYRELRDLVAKGEDPWQSLASTDSNDTHYAGRMKKHLRELDNSNEEQAVAATDNEGMNCLSDGTVCVLFNDLIKVRQYFPDDLIKLFSVPDPRENPVMMVGDSAVIPACKKLDY
jgi:prepilin-type N-terminal cleavage/methylation domain-containing protein